MEKYIGVKIVKAKPMMLIEAEELLQRKIKSGNEEGYLVEYEDGYQSWSPKEALEKAYRKFGSDKNTVTQDDVDSFIVGIDSTQIGDKTTVVKATLANGFILVESSSCVDVNNFDMKVGTEICIEKIKDKVWFLLGFLLQCGNEGLNN